MNKLERKHNHCSGETATLAEGVQHGMLIEAVIDCNFLSFGTLRRLIHYSVKLSSLAMCRKQHLLQLIHISQLLGTEHLLDIISPAHFSGTTNAFKKSKAFRKYCISNYRARLGAIKLLMCCVYNLEVITFFFMMSQSTLLAHAWLESSSKPSTTVPF